jgi:hypothetical protein
MVNSSPRRVAAGLRGPHRALNAMRALRAESEQSVRGAAAFPCSRPFLSTSTKPSKQVNSPVSDSFVRRRQSQGYQLLKYQDDAPSVKAAWRSVWPIELDFVEFVSVRPTAEPPVVARRVNPHAARLRLAKARSNREALADVPAPILLLRRAAQAMLLTCRAAAGEAAKVGRRFCRTTTG